MFGPDAEKLIAMSPAESTMIDGMNVRVPVDMSSAPTLPWSATESEARFVVLTLYQCAVAVPASGPVFGEIVLLVHSALFRHTTLLARPSLALTPVAVPDCGTAPNPAPLSTSPRLTN